MHLRLARDPDVLLHALPRFVLEGLALELTAIAAREAARSRAPGWLEPVREQIRERCLEGGGVERAALSAGVTGAELATAFRTHYGESPGDYARRLRLEWAAEQLQRADACLASIAADAGFADQSHFTRAFRRQYGLPPGRYRAAFRH